MSILLRTPEEALAVKEFLDSEQDLLAQMAIAEDEDPASTNITVSIGKDIKYAPEAYKDSDCLLGLNSKSTPYFAWGLFAMLAYRLDLHDGKDPYPFYYNNSKVTADVYRAGEEKRMSGYRVHDGTGHPVVPDLDLSRVPPEVQNLIEDSWVSRKAVSELLLKLSERLSAHDFSPEVTLTKQKGPGL